MSVRSELRAGLSGFDLWPDEIPGRGCRTVGPLTRCASCPARATEETATTFVRYGRTPLCLVHARAERTAASLPGGAA